MKNGRLQQWLDSERVELMVGRLKQMEQELISIVVRVRESDPIAATFVDEMLAGVTRAAVMGEKIIKEKKL